MVYEYTFKHKKKLVLSTSLVIIALILIYFAPRLSVNAGNQKLRLYRGQSKLYDEQGFQVIVILSGCNQGVAHFDIYYRSFPGGRLTGPTRIIVLQGNKIYLGDLYTLIKSTLNYIELEVVS